jgi:hypothetical protein
MLLKHLYPIAVAAILGCGSSSGTSSQSPAPRRANLLTAEEILAAHADVTTAYDALARLRPNWLTSRGPTSFINRGTEFAIVFVDGEQYGTLTSLRNIHASQVADIRYYSSAEAGGRFGVRAGTSGVIEVRMNLRLDQTPPPN